MAELFLPFDCITLAVALNGLMANASFRAHSTADGRAQEWAMEEKKDGIICMWRRALEESGVLVCFWCSTCEVTF